MPNMLTGDDNDAGMPPSVTDADLDAWEALANGATEGPWRVGSDRNTLHSDHFDVLMSYPECGIVICESDAAFIAASREAVPRLIAALREALAADPVRAALAVPEARSLLLYAMQAAETESGRNAMRVLADAAKSNE